MSLIRESGVCHQSVACVIAQERKEFVFGSDGCVSYSFWMAAEVNALLQLARRIGAVRLRDRIARFRQVYDRANSILPFFGEPSFPGADAVLLHEVFHGVVERVHRRRRCRKIGAWLLSTAGGWRLLRGENGGITGAGTAAPPWTEMG